MIVAPAFTAVPRARLSGLPTDRESPVAHLVGICGSGMKALAEMLSGLGWTISGSDLQPPPDSLEMLGRKGFQVHC